MVGKTASARIALLSDIHGNSVALDAVLADIAERGGADEYWILGDLVALGPDPVGVLRKLTELPKARFIRGNTDRYVAFGDRPEPTISDAQADPTRLSALVEVANTFAWTQGMITSAGWFDWLKALPLEMTSSLSDGSLFLGVHASPGRDDGDGFRPDTTATRASELLAGSHADLVCVGHTHLPSMQTYGSQSVISLGSVSLSRTSDKFSSYAMLKDDPRGRSIEFFRVPYDRSRVIGQLVAAGHPARAFLIMILGG